MHQSHVLLSVASSNRACGAGVCFSLDEMNGDLVSQAHVPVHGVLVLHAPRARGYYLHPRHAIPLKNNWKSSRNRIGRLAEIRFATPADIPLQDLYLVLTRTPRKFGICPLFKEPFSVAPR